MMMRMVWGRIYVMRRLAEDILLWINPGAAVLVAICLSQQSPSLPTMRPLVGIVLGWRLRFSRFQYRFCLLCLYYWIDSPRRQLRRHFSNFFLVCALPEMMILCGASRNTIFAQFSLLHTHTNYTLYFFKKPDWFANNNNNEDSEDEDNDANGSAAAAAAAHHVLLLLDCAATMFAPVHPDPEFPDGERLSSVQFALQTVQDTVRRKIRQVTVHKSGRRDGLGVLLYNTKYRAPRPSDEEEEEEEKDAKKESTNNNEDAEEEDDETTTTTTRSKAWVRQPLA